MEDQKRILEEAFGESSGGEDDDLQEQQSQIDFEDLKDGGQPQSIFGENASWERISEIKGFWLCRDFLNRDQQYSLLSAIENEGWFTEASQNQAMRFGDLPMWATELANLIREVVHFSDYAYADMAACENDEDACLFPSNLLWREPLFDQLIVNLYQPGEGICAHVDLLRFEDGIAIVSLESSCVMHFTHVGSKFGITQKESEMNPSMAKVPVYLSPGSLVLMWGEARYSWKHEINRKPGFQKWEGKDIDQGRRISITLRKLCQNE